MKRILSCFVLLGSVLFAASNSYATIISGVTASTNMGTGFGSDISNIVDGSGLSSTALDATHARASPDNSWVSVSTSLTGMVTFNLNGVYNLAGMSVWNFNGADPFAGVNLVNIQTSPDGINFTLLAGAPAFLAIGSFVAVTPAQEFQWAPMATSFVRFEILSNHGTNQATGLSEVAFDGAVTLVPEPATAVLLGSGLLGVMGFVRRHRSQTVS